MEILIWFTSKWLNKNLKLYDDKVRLRNFHTEMYYFYFSLPGIFLVDFSIFYADFGSWEGYRRLNGAISLRKNRISAHMEPWRPKIHRFERFQNV